MLLSRANLEVVNVASKESFAAALNGVRVEPDGSTVASDGKCIVAVSPFEEGAMKAKFPEMACERRAPDPDGMILPLDSAARVLRHMPKGDTALEVAALSKVTDARRIGLTVVDAKGNPTTFGVMPKHEQYPLWQKVFQQMYADTFRLCVSRRSLLNLLNTLDKACPAKGDVDPVFLNVSKDGRGLIVRCMNYETRQRAVGLVAVYDTRGEWLDVSRWERKVLQGLKALKRKVLRRRVTNA